MKRLMNKAVAILAIMLACAASEARVVDLDPSNTVTLRGVITDESVSTVMQKLAVLDAKRGSDVYPIYLVMESPGGDIQSGTDLIEYAKTLKNLHTITIFAASMASAVVEALPGQRLIISTGTLMFHRAKGGFEGQFETGEVESRLEWAKSIVRNLEITNAARMGLPLSLYKTKVLNEYWLFGREALDKNGADEIISIQCSASLQNMSQHVTFETLFGPVSVSFSACPLFKGFKPDSKDDSMKLQKHNKLIKEIKSAKAKN